jgi:hypothetical protein
MASSKRVGKRKKKPFGLTPQQEKFCQHYALSKSGAQAYAHAYPVSRKHTPQYRAEQASKILADDKVRARVQVLCMKVVAMADKKFEITAEKVLQEMAALAFANSDDYFAWGSFERPVYNRKTGEPRLDGDGRQILESVPYVRIKPSDELTRVQKSAIIAAEETISKTGERVISVKMGPKLQALKHLGDFLRLFDTPNDGGPPIPGMVVNGNVTVNNTDITAIDDKREALKAFQSMRASAMIVDASTPDQSR